MEQFIDPGGVICDCWRSSRWILVESLVGFGGVFGRLRREDAPRLTPRWRCRELESAGWRRLLWQLISGGCALGCVTFV